MPVHDQGYRRYQGARVPPGRAWVVIAKTGLLALVRRRLFAALMLLAWFPFLVRVVQIYAAANVPRASFLAPDARLFRQFLDQQEVFLFFITVYAGAGLIANDRRANALSLYLSKPLTRMEYVFGKCVILMSLLLAVTWAPAMLLLVVQVLFSGSLTFLAANLFLVPAITLFSFTQAIVVTTAMLALSSMSSSSRYVGILYAGLLFFSQALYGILFIVTRDSGLAWISVASDLALIGDAMFRLPYRYQLPLPVALVVVAALVAVSLVIVRARVRGIEVVA